MPIAELFLNLHNHHTTAEFSESTISELDAIALLFALNFDEAGNQIKAILEKRYTDGISGFKDVKIQGSKIEGIFYDIVSPSLTKSFNFTIDADTGAVDYTQINSGNLEPEHSEYEFAAPAKKSKQCNEGKSSACTRTDGSVYCIRIGYKCKSVGLSEQEKAVVKGIVEKGSKTKTKKANTKIPKLKAEPKAEPPELKIPEVTPELIKAYQKEMLSDPVWGADNFSFIVSRNKSIIKYDKEFKAKKYDPIETAALTHYTNATGEYALINSVLRGSDQKVAAIMQDREKSGDKRNIEEIRQRVAIQTALINSALDKMPNYEGKVYRVSALDPAIANSYKVGQEITEKGFTSTGTEKPIGINIKKGKIETIFNIKSKTGKSISKFSDTPQEDEVLFKSGTKFKVTKKREENGKIIIEMEEV
jgi:hypothetical protein